MRLKIFYKPSHGMVREASPLIQNKKCVSPGVNISIREYKKMSLVKVIDLRDGFKKKKS